MSDFRFCGIIYWFVYRAEKSLEGVGFGFGFGFGLSVVKDFLNGSPVDRIRLAIETRGKYSGVGNIDGGNENLLSASCKKRKNVGILLRSRSKKRAIPMKLSEEQFSNEYT